VALGRVERGIDEGLHDATRRPALQLRARDPELGPEALEGPFEGVRPHREEDRHQPRLALKREDRRLDT
jgi:hypothetical protein